MKRILIVFVLLAIVTNTFASEGFDVHYVVYEGDFNSDGRTDLYIKQKPQVIIIHGIIATPIVISPKPDVTPFVLVQNTDKTFTINGNLTSFQKAMLNDWPESNIELTIGDFNIDGVLDILLEGVSNVITNAFNQIVFADSNYLSSPPIHVKAMNNDVQQFFAEIDHVLFNPNYFADHISSVPQTIQKAGWFYLLEICALPSWAAENPLENLPGYPAYRDDLEDIYDSEEAFMLDCITNGYTAFHYDYVYVYYYDTVYAPDYSVFNQDALSISDEINYIIDEGGLTDGSQEKSIIKIVLESIFGVGVFGPKDDDYETNTFFENIIYLAQLAENDPVGMGSCPYTPDDIPYYVNMAYLESYDNFITNVDLSTGGKIQVYTNANFTTITVDFNLYFEPSVILKDGIIKGIRSWTTCGTIPSGAVIQLNVNPTIVDTENNADVKVITKIRNDDDDDCDNAANTGGNTIFECTDTKSTGYRLGRHEFGHILGFPNAYYEGTSISRPGFERDIMSIGTKIYSYHLHILAQMYN